MYGSQMLQSTEKMRGMTSAEDAGVFATTVGQYPAGSPLYTQSKELQQYVAQLSKQTGRDIVVMDKDKKILADTVPANVGKKFTEDKGNEVAQTLGDNQARTFIEKSSDYPQGIVQTVVPIKNAAGITVGAVVISSSQAFK